MRAACSCPRDERSPPLLNEDWEARKWEKTLRQRQPFFSFVLVTFDSLFCFPLCFIFFSVYKRSDCGKVPVLNSIFVIWQVFQSLKMFFALV